MNRGIGFFAAILLCAGASSALASPWTPQGSRAAIENSCDALAELQGPDQTFTLALESMTEICRSGARDDAMLARAARALDDWAEAETEMQAAAHRGRFYRALAALEAEAELFAADVPLAGADAAVTPAPLETPDPEIAIFTLEEAAAPFLGPVAGAGSRVLIAVEAPDYSDLFTVYFPNGSAYLTLPAEDMIAMAAEAVRPFSEAEVWVSAGPVAQSPLAADRAAAVEGILLQSDIPGGWIHVDDGGFDAIMNRPESLNGNTEL